VTAALDSITHISLPGLPILFPCSGPASKNTYVILERALDWRPGSIDMILAGSEPTEDGAPGPLRVPKPNGRAEARKSP